jgi:netrin-G3 ligand
MVLCGIFQISFDAVKEFVDSQGITQMQNVPRRIIMLEPTVLSHTINELSPFTTYNVNVSAIPSDHQYRPPTKITVTTQMAGLWLLLHYIIWCESFI